MSNLSQKIQQYKDTFNQKIESIVKKKEEMLSKVEEYKKKMDDIEKDIILSTKEKNIQKKIYLEKIHITIHQANEYAESKKQQAQEWIDAKIQQLVLNGDSLDKLDKDTIASF